MEPLYRVPIIAQDLRQEENIIQVADALEHLSRVSDHVFSRIARRISEGQKRTDGLLARIQVCSRKVEQLSTTDKAIKVFSASKYPAMDCYKNYKSIFSKDDDGVPFRRTPGVFKSKLGVCGEKEAQSKLEFYHIKVSNPDESLAVRASLAHTDVAPLQSACSLLLYGTGELVAGGVSLGGSALRSNRGRPQQQAPPPSDMDAPPVSLLQRDLANKRPAESYLYSPGMGEVPEMDVPKDLPHLPGIAGDMQFTSETFPAIAPSAGMPTPVESTSTPAFPNEPSTDLAPLKAKEIRLEEAKRVEEPVKKIEEERMVVPEKVAPPPPPPPPPLPTPESLPEVDATPTVVQRKPQSKKVEVKPSIGGDTLDSRASLMDAIRKAGGSGKAKLRSTATTAEPHNEGGAVKSGGGDLMADLHAKLSMRRKGISGTRAEGTILAAISAIVPLPTPDLAAPSDSASASSSAEDDWE